METRSRARKPCHRRTLRTTALVLVALITAGCVSGDPGDPDKTADPPTSASDSKADAADDAGAESEAKPDESSTPADSAATGESEPKTFLVTDVVDGDTLKLGNGKTVRVVGIDTPEVGECGYEQAADKLASLVLGERVLLTKSDENTDRYGRLLRYVNIGGMDAGLREIKAGLAVARYDSRDGYGEHPREDSYIAMDKETKNKSCRSNRTPQSFASGGGGQNGKCMVGYSPCLPVVADLDCGEIGHAVTVTGSDPYALDADGDHVGCDS